MVLPWLFSYLVFLVRKRTYRACHAVYAPFDGATLRVTLLGQCAICSKIYNVTLILWQCSNTGPYKFEGKINVVFVYIGKRINPMS
jgi:hypothetical protein